MSSDEKVVGTKDSEKTQLDLYSVISNHEARSVTSYFALLSLTTQIDNYSCTVWSVWFEFVS